MTHVRTFSRYISAVGLAACILALVPSLAFAQNYAVHRVKSYSSKTIPDARYVRDSSGRFVPNPAAKNFNVSTRSSVNVGGLVRHKNVVSTVSKSTVRRGAISLISRGIPHPGLQVALAAAGLMLSSDGELQKEGSYLPDGTIENPYSDGNYPGFTGTNYKSYLHNGVYYPDPYQAGLVICSE